MYNCLNIFHKMINIKNNVWKLYFTFNYNDVWWLNDVQKIKLIALVIVLCEQNDTRLIRDWRNYC